MLDLKQVAGVIVFALVGLVLLYAISSAASFILANIGVIAVLALAAAVVGFVLFGSLHAR